MIKHLFTTLCALALITAGSIPALEIGRASCRERVYVLV